MTPEDTQALRTHLEAAAAILFKNTPTEQLQNFESIERNVRDQVLQQVSPQIGNFFTQRHSNHSGVQATTPELLGCADGEPQASRAARTEGAGAAESAT